MTKSGDLVVKVELNSIFIFLFLLFIVILQRKMLFLHKLNYIIMATKDLNRLKLVLVELKMTATAKT